MATNNEAISYENDGLVAGNIVSGIKTAAAATYYRGQVLGRVNTTNVYGAYNSGGADGTENIKAVCAKDLTLSAEGLLPVYITGSEVQDSFLKDSAGDALSVTAVVVENAQDNGIIIK